jgi:hypothetical protein
MKYISYRRVPQRCATFAGNVTKLSTMRTRKPGHLIPSVSRPASTSTWSATTTERTRPPAIQDRLARHPRFHVHFTLSGSSWINQVERWFGYPTDQKIRRGVHKSIQARGTGR